jgi:MOSC domain-containing protein YiiM
MTPSNLPVPRTEAELAAALAAIRAAPRDAGTVELIVARPTVDERAVLTEAVLVPGAGLEGDRWRARGAGQPDPERELTLMSARAIAALAADREHWPLAGDQLYVDLDLSTANAPPGTRLAVGTAIVEVSAVPHTGCAKLLARFGSAAARWVNSPEGRALRLRGLNARVIQGGVVRVGDTIARR